MPCNFEQHISYHMAMASNVYFHLKRYKALYLHCSFCEGGFLLTRTPLQVANVSDTVWKML